MTTRPDRVARNTRIVRKLREMTQIELGDRTGLSIARVLEIERGTRRRVHPITAAELRAVAEALDVAVSVLTNPLPPLPRFSEHETAVGDGQ